MFLMLRLLYRNVSVQFFGIPQVWRIFGNVAGSSQSICRLHWRRQRPLFSHLRGSCKRRRSRRTGSKIVRKNKCTMHRQWCSSGAFVMSDEFWLPISISSLIANQNQSNLLKTWFRPFGCWRIFKSFARRVCRRRWMKRKVPPAARKLPKMLWKLNCSNRRTRWRRWRRNSKSKNRSRKHSKKPKLL